MSFTEDELQSFNTILEQRLLAHRRDLEHTFDQRISEYRRETEQRLFAMQQEMLGSLEQKLARQMQSIETLLNRQSRQLAEAAQDDAGVAILPNGNRQIEAIEVQTELPWEDLADVIGQTLDARLTALNEESRRLIDNLEQRLAGRLHGIDHLERVIESLQVVMTANHALLSDRLYSHQQQPLERAHPAARLEARTPAERDSPVMLSQAKEQGADEPAPASTNHE